MGTLDLRNKRGKGSLPEFDSLTSLTSILNISFILLFHLLGKNAFGIPFLPYHTYHQTRKCQN